MAANAGRKRGYQHRDRNTAKPDIVVEAIASIVQHDLQFHSVIPKQQLKKRLNYIIAQISVSKCQGITTGQ